MVMVPPGIPGDVIHVGPARLDHQRGDPARTAGRAHAPAAGDQIRRAGPFADLRQERPIMSKDSTSKANVKKKGKTLKEKQTAKRVKRDEQAGHPSTIPTTGR
jgi:hypothetical protein